MKHLKPYKIFESQELHPGFPKAMEMVNWVCEKYNITNYTINDNLSIDVEGDVNLYNKGLKYLPLNFNIVSGNFYTSGNNLKTLVGSPVEVGGSFFCSENELYSFKGSPEKIKGGFNCSVNNLTSLEYLPREIDYSSEYTDFLFNPIYTLINTFIIKDNAIDLIQEFKDYYIIQKDKVILGRLEAFISDFDLEMPDMDEAKEFYKIV